ncbi:MAG TPA: adenylosuccinate synthase [Thermoanaerobaculia bacterium]|nr:adenylosuccinate synthase [Thermoanaerobaculia bacterium]
MPAAEKRNLAVLGAQWGDEGKGKIVDLLCEHFDIVARFQGGHNAGHTVKFADKHYSLHLIPSGILHPGKICVLGNGMVIDPHALLTEMEKLASLGVTIGDELLISDSAHCILPIHAALDKAREEYAGGSKIGTTGRGIGPAYEMKASRFGIRMRDLLDEEILRGKIETACHEKNALLKTVYGGEAFEPESLVQGALRHGEILRKRIVDTSIVLDEARRDGRRIMFEGAQGSLLDIDHGTYPFVTSSNCTAGGIATGLGIAPKQIHEVMGVAKAYTTRVGSGPFPTELLDDVGERLRKRGNEYGTTTGRPRRTGWLDLVVLRSSAMLNGFDEIALTKLDVFDEFEEIPVCVSYDTPDGETRNWPRALVDSEKVRPRLKTMKGWKKPTIGVREFDDLPQEARDYVKLIEDELECPIAVVSTGPRREETIIRGGVLAAV